MQVLRWVYSNPGSTDTVHGRGEGGMEREPPTLLCVAAHPEDATLAFGGLIARYAQAGVKVHLVTATLGDLGWYGDMGDYPGVEDLIRIRRCEAGRAASALGVHREVSLGYPDARLDEMDRSEVVLRIAREVRRTRPQVVVTFGQDERFGHPDHNALSSLCSEAVRVASQAKTYVEGYPPHKVARFYHLVWSPSAVTRYEAAFAAFDEVSLTRQPGAIAPYVTRVDASEGWRRVAVALECHGSQLVGFKAFRTLDEAVQRRLWQDVELEQVAGCNASWAPADDVFAGLGVQSRTPAGVA